MSRLTVKPVYRRDSLVVSRNVINSGFGLVRVTSSLCCTILILGDSDKPARNHWIVPSSETSLGTHRRDRLITVGTQSESRKRSGQDTGHKGVTTNGVTPFNVGTSFPLWAPSPRGTFGDNRHTSEVTSDRLWAARFHSFTPSLHRAFTFDSESALHAVNVTQLYHRELLSSSVDPSVLEPI